jgi:hypothetical protein
MVNSSTLSQWPLTAAPVLKLRKDGLYASAPSGEPNDSDLYASLPMAGCTVTFRGRTLECRPLKAEKGLAVNLNCNEATEEPNDAWMLRADDIKLHLAALQLVKDQILL